MKFKISHVAKTTDVRNRDKQQTLHVQHLPWTDNELLIAKTIFETKYPDARWENLHPNRLIRLQRLLEARAVAKVLKL